MKGFSKSVFLQEEDFSINDFTKEEITKYHIGVSYEMEYLFLLESGRDKSAVYSEVKRLKEDTSMDVPVRYLEYLCDKDEVLDGIPHSLVLECYFEMSHPADIHLNILHYFVGYAPIMADVGETLNYFYENGVEFDLDEGLRYLKELKDEGHELGSIGSLIDEY